MASGKRTIDPARGCRPTGRIATLPAGISGRSLYWKLREALRLEARQLQGEGTRLIPSKPVAEIASGGTQQVALKAGSRLPQSKTRTLAVGSAILENHRAGKSSLEELVLELHHAEVSLRALDEITAALWGGPLNSEAIGQLSDQVKTAITTWIRRPLAGRYPLLFVEGTLLRWRASHGECCVPILAAMSVNAAGYREIVDVRQGSTMEAADFAALFRSLRERRLEGVDLCIGDHLSGFASGLREVFPTAAHQGCITRFRQRALALATHGRAPQVDEMFDGIYGCRDASSAREKIREAIVALEGIGQGEVAELLENRGEPTLAFLAYPKAVRPFVCRNATLMRSLRAVRERARTIGAFSDGPTAITLATARLRHQMRTEWGRFRYGK